MPKAVYKLMECEATMVLANACPLHLLLKSKWGIKYSRKHALNGIKGGFFEEMTRQHQLEGSKVGFGQGLYAVSVQT